jgi:oligoendopeptidase F
MSISRALQTPSDTWDLTPLYPSSVDWKKDLEEEASTQYSELTAPYIAAKTLTEEQLFDLFTLYFRLERRLKKLYTWAHLYHDQDTANDEAKQALQRITSRYHDFSESFSWMEPKILSHTAEQLSAFVSSKKLEPYKTLLERLLRLKPHTLPAEQEALMAMSGRALEAASKAFSAINDADFRFADVKDTSGTTHPLTHATYGVLLRSPDRTLRQHAFETLHSTYRSYENTLTELLSGQAQQHLFQARARGYSSCLEAALFPNNIPVSVYHNLINTVRSRISVLHTYLRLKRKALHLTKLAPWDLYAPLTEEAHTIYPFEEAVQLTLDAAQPLGPSYVQRLRDGLSMCRWVDRYENQNKRSGAYSSGCYDSPPYILMNYKGQLRDVFTLAHEAGHSMHSDSSRRQPYHYSDYAIFVAEVASTFNEELLSNELLRRNKDNPKVRAAILNEKLEDLRATLFRQTLFAEFELFVHERAERGEPITPTILGQKFRELNQFYYGEEIEFPEVFDAEWSRIPHFYYNFYVYQYATGISAANALVARVLGGGEQERNQYLAFLQGGCSAFPIDLLRNAGVDMCSAAPIESALHRFSSLIGEFSAALQEVK